MLFSSGRHMPATAVLGRCVSGPSSWYTFEEPDIGVILWFFGPWFLAHFPVH